MSEMRTGVPVGSIKVVKTVVASLGAWIVTSAQADYTVSHVDKEPVVSLNAGIMARSPDGWPQRQGFASDELILRNAATRASTSERVL